MTEPAVADPIAEARTALTADPGNAEKAAAMNNAYKARYPPSEPEPSPPAAAVPVVTGLTPEAARARIATLCAEQMSTPHVGGPRDEQIDAELKKLYQHLYPPEATSETSEGTAPEAEPDRLPDLPAGFQWDTAALMDVYQTVEREGLPRAEFHQGVALAAQLAAGPVAPTSQEAEATLREKWGGDYDAKLTAARGVVKRLPARVLDYLDDTGLGDHPAMIEHFAELATRLPARAGG